MRPGEAHALNVAVASVSVAAFAFRVVADGARVRSGGGRELAHFAPPSSISSRAILARTRLSVLSFTGFCINLRRGGGDSLFLSIAEIEVNPQPTVGDCEFLENAVKLDIGCRVV